MRIKNSCLPLFLFLNAAFVCGNDVVETFSHARSADSFPRALDSLKPAVWADAAEELLVSAESEPSLEAQTRLAVAGLLLQSFAGDPATLDEAAVSRLRDLAERYRRPERGIPFDHRWLQVSRELEALAAGLTDPVSGTDPEAWAEFHELLSAVEAPADPAAATRSAPRSRGFFGGLIEAVFTVDDGGHGSETSIERGKIPALLNRLEIEEATDLLDRALAVRVDWSLTDHPATARLARERALAGIDQMQVPVWGWVGGDSADALYTALLDRFGRPTGGGYNPGLWSFQRASAAALVQRGLRGDDAGVLEIAGFLDWADYVPIQVSRLRAKPAQKAALFDALLAVQQAYPEADLWERLRPLGAEAGRGSELVEAARELAESAPSEASRMQARTILAASLLADDQVEAGGTLLLENVQRDGTGEAFLEAALNDATQLMQLGALLERGDWVDLGLAAFCRHFEAYLSLQNSTYSLESNLQAAMLALDWQPAAEPWERLHSWLVQLSEDAPQAGPYDFGNELTEDLLRRLCIDLLAYRGAHAEVLQRAREFSGWQADDIGGLIEEGAQAERPVFFSSYPLLLARSLQATGAADEAGAIARALLPRYQGQDPVYTLFLETHSESEALSYLERIQSMDAFEERPLIWKAQIQLEAGHYAKARETVQQAIAIDPSDGEQERGTRMRAYGILRAVAEAEGAADEASLLQGVVAAIRLSEDADRLWQAGLLSRALAMYRDSLDLFGEAYCIQSRLALRFAEEGRMDAAREHYRRAYELMPDSFGRIESHCFGCEGAFRGEAAQSIAETVFLSMLAERPEHPQLHYLLGYLRENQDEPGQAADHYRRAAELDPLYYNAWSKLLGLRDQVAMPIDEQREIFLRMIALDPALVRVPARDFWPLVDDPARLWELGRAGITWTSLFDDLPNTPQFPAAAARRAAEATETRRRYHHRHERTPAVGPGDYLVRLPAGAHAAEIYRLLAELGL
jgi:tetratricopeptide (TPR) repeat protein